MFSRVFYSDSAVYESTTSSPGSGPILLNNMNCNGTEESVFDCQNSKVESDECDHNEDVVVSCLAPPEGIHSTLSTFKQKYMYVNIYFTLLNPCGVD